MLASLDRRRFLSGLAAAMAAGPMLLAQDPPHPHELEDVPFKPDTLFLTWQRDPTTTMTIQWIGPERAGGDPVIRYRNRGTADWLFGPATRVRPFPVVEMPKPAAKVIVPPALPGEREIAPMPKGPILPTGPTDFAVHRAELSGLTPNTEYEFIIGTRSPTYRFRTMPATATKEFSFISGGDCATNSHTLANNRIAAAQDPMFALIGGDLGYDNGTSGDVALQFIRNYASTMIDSQGRLIPLVTCLGNHEVRGGYAKSMNAATFFTPLFDGLFSEQSYAALDFGNYLSLILLDTNHCSPVKGAQTDWLDRTLAERSGMPNLIVANHVPAYPSFREAESKTEKGGGTGEDQRTHWSPLFEQYQVDAVLEHHDHTFKRTKPIKAGKVDEHTGIVYLGDGSWGRLRAPKAPEKTTYLDEVSTNYHITLHRLEGEERYHLAFGETGKVLDIFHTAKKPRHYRPTQR